MSKKYCIFITALFCAFIGVFLVANAVSPDRTFSQMENRQPGAAAHPLGGNPAQRPVHEGL